MTRKPPKGKSLAELNPELDREWHPAKKGDLTPYEVECTTNIAMEAYLGGKIITKKEYDKY
jgi:hypothetical protein